MRDARVLFGLTVLGLFSRKAKAAPPAAVAVSPPPAPPKPAVVTPTQPTYKPPQSLRPNHMKCQDCGKEFKFFSNSDGKPTTCRCPGCGRQYRV